VTGRVVEVTPNVTGQIVAAQHESGDYIRWFIEHAFVLVPAQAIVGQHILSYQQFPPRQRPGSFSVDQAMEKLRPPPANN
jgi:arylsulfatase